MMITCLVAGVLTYCGNVTYFYPQRMESAQQVQIPYGGSSLKPLNQMSIQEIYRLTDPMVRR